MQSTHLGDVDDNDVDDNDADPWLWRKFTF